MWEPTMRSDPAKIKKSRNTGPELGLSGSGGIAWIVGGVDLCDTDVRWSKSVGGSGCFRVAVAVVDVFFGCDAVLCLGSLVDLARNAVPYTPDPFCQN